REDLCGGVGQNPSCSVSKPGEKLQETFDLCKCKQRLLYQILTLIFSGEFISQCGNRYHVFDNRKKNDRTQVRELMKKIDNMMKENGGGCYTNDMLLQAEIDIKKDIKRIMEAGQDKIRRERDALERRSERDKKKIDKLTEKKRQLQKQQLEDELSTLKRSIKADIERISDLQQQLEKKREEIEKHQQEINKRQQEINKQINKIKESTQIGEDTTGVNK
uniref:AIG1-type G domain-containing protein n=1 Tax=Periophthalmus magnuspinnatus TaxID=409849 RepID=A0A3B3ZXY1_9GOBI